MAAGIAYRAAESGLVTYLIDAPVEKGRGKWTKLKGSVSFDPSDLTKTRGHVDVDLADLTTYTFDDPAKNAKQTEHAHNWLEIGSEVSPAIKEKYRWAIFSIASVLDASSRSLKDVQEKEGVRTVTLTARGSLYFHGVHAPATAKLVAAFSGPPDAPSSVAVRTAEPFPVSLSRYDVKPRDVVGKFIDGALKVVLDNKKIVDTAQVSVEKLELVRGP